MFGLIELIKTFKSCKKLKAQKAKYNCDAVMWEKQGWFAKTKWYGDI